MQNANDAGASKCALLLNLHSYGTSSLLAPSMKTWQGPAMYFWNDATFTPHDFQNLSRLGQGSKMGKTGAVGRFGLGFNSCYHLTGTCFVWGAALGCWLPGLTPRGRCRCTITCVCRFAGHV